MRQGLGPCGFTSPSQQESTSIYLWYLHRTPQKGYVEMIEARRTSSSTKYLFTRGHNQAKLRKGFKGYESVILHLSPHKSAETGENMCPWSTLGCRSSCLYTAGRGRMQSARRARENRTFMYVNDRYAFIQRIHEELNNLKARAGKAGKAPIARLNGTSDIPWEDYLIPQNHKSIQFWDYTKSLERMTQYVSGVLPKNYHLTFSRSEQTDPSVTNVLINMFNANVAVVFDTPKSEELPTTWEGHEVIDGRVHDHRFDDPTGKIVGLSALGAAKKDKTGFVVRL